jgi:hypothetical protein
LSVSSPASAEKSAETLPQADAGFYSFRRKSWPDDDSGACPKP